LGELRSTNRRTKNSISNEQPNAVVKTTGGKKSGYAYHRGGRNAIRRVSQRAKTSRKKNERGLMRGRNNKGRKEKREVTS